MKKDDLAIDIEKFYYFISAFSAICSLNASTDFRSLQYLNVRTSKPTNTAKLANTHNIDFSFEPIPFDAINDLTRNMGRVPLLLDISVNSITDLFGSDAEYAANVLSEMYDPDSPFNWRSIIYSAIDALSLAVIGLSFLSPVPGDELFASAIFSARLQRLVSLLGIPAKGTRDLKYIQVLLSAGKHTDTLLISEKDALDFIQYGINIWGSAWLGDYLKSGIATKFASQIEQDNLKRIARDLTGLIAMEASTTFTQQIADQRGLDIKISNLHTKILGTIKLFSEYGIPLAYEEAEQLVKDFVSGVNNVTVDEIIQLSTANNDMRTSLIPQSQHQPDLSPIDSNENQVIDTKEWDVAWWRTHMYPNYSGPGYDQRISTIEDVANFESSLSNIDNHPLARPGIKKEIDSQISLIYAYYSQFPVNEQALKNEIIKLNKLVGL